MGVNGMGAAYHIFLQDGATNGCRQHCLFEACLWHACGMRCVQCVLKLQGCMLQDAAPKQEGPARHMLHATQSLLHQRMQVAGPAQRETRQCSVLLWRVVHHLGS